MKIKDIDKIESIAIIGLIVGVCILLILGIAFGKDKNNSFGVKNERMEMEFKD